MLEIREMFQTSALMRRERFSRRRGASGGSEGKASSGSSSNVPLTRIVQGLFVLHQDSSVCLYSFMDREAKKHGDFKF